LRSLSTRASAGKTPGREGKKKRKKKKNLSREKRGEGKREEKRAIAATFLPHARVTEQKEKKKKSRNLWEGKKKKREGGKERYFPHHLSIGDVPSIAFTVLRRGVNRAQRGGRGTVQKGKGRIAASVPFTKILLALRQI